MSPSYLLVAPLAVTQWLCGLGSLGGGSLARVLEKVDMGMYCGCSGELEDPGQESL